MTRIIYGVSGEGSGHSTRARIIAKHLQSQGHEVTLASYDRGYRNLKDDFQVLEIEGLTIGSENNQVSLVKTIKDNLSRLPEASRRLGDLRALFKSFRPHVVLTDFEPMTAYLAHHYQLPLISIDNQHRMRYISAPVPPGLEREARMTRAIIRAMVPKPDVSIITTFVQGPPKHERVFQFRPMIDPQVSELACQPVPANAPLLVYLTSGFEDLIHCLSRFPREQFRVYGCGVDAGDTQNVRFLSPSRTGFLVDLQASKAVIATAGFTLISEALFLGKPYLAYPMQGQYEQQLNAYQLQEAGFGKQAEGVRREEIAAFLYDLPDYEAALKCYDRQNNNPLFDKLDDLLRSDGALSVTFRNRRKTRVA